MVARKVAYFLICLVSHVLASMAQLAERSAVNRQVLGSIPSGGVFFSHEYSYSKIKSHRVSNIFNLTFIYK